MNGSVMNMVCYERGLLRTWSVMNWSAMNVVCYERICYKQVCCERDLFRMVCSEWSVMKKSVLKGNRSRIMAK